MSYHFHVGQQVVCVDDSPSREGGACLPIVAGRVYTISAMWRCQFRGIGVDLVEAPAPIDGGAFSAFYAARRFRPVKKTSIEIFQRMLAPTDKEKVS